MSRKIPYRQTPDAEEIIRRYDLRNLLRRKRITDFKRTRAYKVMNILNLLCFFISWELLICFLGPCRFAYVGALSLGVHYGYKKDEQGRLFVKDVKVILHNGKTEVVRVNDFVPPGLEKKEGVYIGRDYLFSKELLARFTPAGQSFPTVGGGPVIFISCLSIVVSLIAYYFDLNLHNLTLPGLSIFNLLALFFLVFV